MGLLFGKGHEAYEPRVHEVKMELKMHFTLLLVSLLFQFGLVCWLLWDEMPKAEWTGVFGLVLVKFSFWFDFLGVFDFSVPLYDPVRGLWLKVPFDLLPHRADLIGMVQAQANKAWARSFSTFLITSPILVGWPLGWLYFVRRAKTQRQETFLRGSKELSAKALARATKKLGRLPFGPVLLPKQNEVLHSLVVGAIGMGKTVLLSGVLAKLIELEEPVICHDFKGDFTSRFFNPERDVLFNPCDARGVSWNLFDEIDCSSIDAAKLEVENICSILIPEPSDRTDPIWTMAPRDVLRGVLLGLIEKGRTTNADIYQIIGSSNQEIKTFLESTKLGKPGAAHIEATNKSNFTQSVLSILRAHTNFFQYMDDQGERFSIDQWLKERKGNIFLLNSPVTKEALKPILTLFLDLLVRRLLSLPESRERRIHFLLDELGQLKKSGSLQDLITLGRSKGAAVFLGIQDFGQLDQIYGRNGRISIVNSVGNSAVFGLNDPDTARYLADKLGKKEVLEVSDSVSMGVSDIRDGKTLNHQHRELYLYRPEELLRLAPLELIASFRGYDPARIKLVVTDRPELERPFVMKPGVEFTRPNLATGASPNPSPPPDLEPEEPDLLI